MADPKTIANCLKPWLAVGTWHTSHEFDEKRFYQAVKHLNTTVGTTWSEGEFEDAVYEVIGEKSREAFGDTVQEYASLAVHLRDYERI